jgi:hypothetical protein
MVKIVLIGKNRAAARRQCKPHDGFVGLRFILRQWRRVMVNRR